MFSNNTDDFNPNETDTDARRDQARPWYKTYLLETIVAAVVIAWAIVTIILAF
jgi:hypothetical protein